MQEYSAVNLTIFAKLLAEPSVPEWLTGVRCFSDAWLAANGLETGPLVEKLMWLS